MARKLVSKKWDLPQKRILPLSGEDKRKKMPEAAISPIEIYKSLNRSNCGECQVRTCFAFASLVTQGLKKISDCPHVPEEALKNFGGRIEEKKSLEEEQEASFAALEQKITEIDFKSAAFRLGAELRQHKLVIKCLGKNFSIDKNGHVSSEIHLHQWIKGPLLNYVIGNNEVRPDGKWALFKELPHGERWNPLYLQRCEKPLRIIADEDEELFSQVISLFGTMTDVEGISADLILLAYPLPKIPLLICYCRPEAGFESKLAFYYDRKSEDILNIESLYILATGMSMMIAKIIRRHGIEDKTAAPMA
ncbi:DUF3786 domain-containing protein [Fibrobacterota bacterium]